MEALNKIDGLVKKISMHPEYSRCVSDETSRSLQEEAIKHSLSLELEAVASSNGYCNGSNGSNGRGEKSRVQLTNALKAGWNYIETYGLSTATLAVLGKIVSPDTHPISNFRYTEVQFGEFNGSEKEKVPYHTDNLIAFLQCTKVHPVLRASEAHVQLVAIHPYEDGNGRVARLIQNYCLHERGLPPAIISETERGMYIALMRSTLCDRRDGKSSLEKPSAYESLFHEFLASKVLASAQHLEEVLRKSRMFDVELTRSRGLEKGIVQVVAKKIRAMGLSREGGINVKVGRSDSHRGAVRSLHVKGNVGRERLDSLLRREAGNYSFGYEIISKDCF